MPTAPCLLALPALFLIANSPAAAQVASPCAAALARRAVCGAANHRALELMNAGPFEAATVVQDVRTGALVVFQASQPSRLDVATPVLPLSVSKLLLAASWWEHETSDSGFHEMIVSGSDRAGRQLAAMLRKSAGTRAVLEDFARYGLERRSDTGGDRSFWRQLAPQWRTRLSPAPAYTTLSADISDAEWADALSLGETHLTVTPLHVSRFLQAVGNAGMMLPPVALDEQTPPGARASGRRVMRASAARRLQAAMRDVVRRGTAKSIAAALASAGWQMGGKTGSGPGQVGSGSDGWFAGLAFDPGGKARYTVATFVRHAGPGGGNAARISAAVLLYLIAGPKAGAGPTIRK
jgi:cell division protein FtsI/penicillin-binding protein 2